MTTTATDTTAPPQPVRGEVIRLSWMKYGAEVVISLLASAWIVLVFDQGFLVQGLSWIVAIPIVITRIRSIVLMGQLYRNQRLVIGRDRLQLIENEHDVIGEIPFSEIEDAQVNANGSIGARLEILLYERDGTPSYWPDKTWARRTYRMWHQGRERIIVEPFFTMNATRISDRLLHHLDRYIDCLVFRVPPPGMA